MAKTQRVLGAYVIGHSLRDQRNGGAILRSRLSPADHEGPDGHKPPTDLIFPNKPGNATPYNCTCRSIQCKQFPVRRRSDKQLTERKRIADK